MRVKKIKNPLVKRIPKELRGDWRKYLVVSIFLILTIGFVSGMYVANGSMMKAANDGVTEYKLEDGHFELKHKASDEFISDIQSGDKADVKQYYVDKARSELDSKFESEFKSSFDSEFNGAFDSEFNTKFEAQVLDTLRKQGLDDATAKQMLLAAIQKAKSDGTYKNAYDSAYRTAYNQAYQSAYSSAYDEAWNKVQSEIDKEYADAEEKYDLNNADFKAIPVSVYENFFKNVDEDKNNDGKSDGGVRVFAKTDEVNMASILDGRLPDKDDEIAIDRMHANNAGIKLGDEITVGNKRFKVVGLIAYVNYSTLHEKNTDLMFDAIKFDVAMVTDGGFDSIDGDTHYSYAWSYKESPEDEIEEKSMSENFLKALITQTVVDDNEVEDYLPRYANSAVNFAKDDMGSDMAMGGVLLYILIVIIAFIFAITISNTISKESSTIGTLRASGYTKGELIRHYLAMPVIVTLISAIIGNILGYTCFKNVVVGMYYNSYSLPSYQTVWNGTAFIKTTLIPVIIMLVVNLAIIVKKMQHTPLQFLRHDLKKSRRKKAMRLPSWSFIRRFRFRIILQNIPNYIVLFIGISFISVMLAMAVGMPTTLDYYKENTAKMMFSKYQYVLNGEDNEKVEDIVEANYGNAEKFDMKSLIRKSDKFEEEISVYGVTNGSKYIEIDGLENLKDDEVIVSAPYASKYGLGEGDTIKLDEKYESNKYTFKVAGIYDKCPTIAIFMPIANYEKTFDVKSGDFTGYLSDTELSKIPEDNVTSVITKRDITKMCDQLDHSMGSYMTYFQYLCVLLSAVLIYLLTKIIIEKNESAISMTKILGYDNREIARLYLMSTTIVMVVADAISVLIGGFAMKQAWKAVMATYSGFFELVINPSGYVKMFVFILIGYLIVLFVDFKRIKKIPMDEALKNIE